MSAITGGDALPDLGLERSKTHFGNIMCDDTEAWGPGFEETCRWTNYNDVWLNRILIRTPAASPAIRGPAAWRTPNAGSSKRASRAGAGLAMQALRRDARATAGRR